MKDYILEIHQGEGCDYTIGCGMRLYPFKAESMEEAVTKVERLLRTVVNGATEEEQDEMDDDDPIYNTDWDHLSPRPPSFTFRSHAYDGYQKMVVYEVSQKVDVDISRVHAEDRAEVQRIEAARQAEQRKAKQAARRAEYERMKVEFGDT